MFVLTTKRDFI